MGVGRAAPHDRRMARISRLMVAGWTGLVIGVALVVLAGPGDDVAALMRGYGSLLALSAIWLLGGLALRSLVLGRRAASVRAQPAGLLRRSS